jgi:predicted nucleic acid-binding protein
VITLVDSNVLIAYFDKNHQHNDPSREAVAELDNDEILVSAHTLSEVYNKLTRGLTSAGFAPGATALLVRDFASQVAVHALTADETLTAIAAFAQNGGRGARLYDFLIGYVAIVHGASRIVTWNVRDMAPLFPSLITVSPFQMLET